MICTERGKPVWISEREGAAWQALPPFGARAATGVATLDSQYFVPGFLTQPQSGSFSWIDETAAAARTYSEFARSGLAPADVPGVLVSRLDAYVSAPARPWDHAGGSLVVQNLGAVMRHIDTGLDYSPGR